MTLSTLLTLLAAATPSPSAPLAAGARPLPPAAAPATAAASNRLATPPTGIVGSLHDLSVTGPGPFKSDVERNPCVFCHVPHSPGQSSRPDSSTPIVPYASSTAPGLVAQPHPTGSSRVCLSCHDGTIALGRTTAGTIPMRDTGFAGRLPPGHPANLGTDLRGTHPISVAPPPTTLTHLPPKGDPVQLDATGQVQCTACHDPHRQQLPTGEGNFLQKTMLQAALCITCHDPARLELPGASHTTSLTAVPDPATGASTTMPALRCAGCHDSHGADPRGRLVRRLPGGDDALCLSCHDGRSAPLDVLSVVRRPYAHAAPTVGTTVHDAAEGPQGTPRLPETAPAAPRHVTCVDCHEPHQTTTTRVAQPPGAQSVLAGEWGIDRNGARVQPAQNEYEVCFKCHGDSANQPQQRGLPLPGEPRRPTNEVNLRRIFDPNGASAHPVIGPGRGQDVPSLIAPLGLSSVVYCSDCHSANDGRRVGGNAPNGPHGSIYPHILERAYSTLDGTPESPAAYALCYKCHSRTVLLSSQSSFKLHALHLGAVAGATQPTTCSVCHDAHGISALSGNPVNNAHLVEFDLNVVQPPPHGAAPAYTTRGFRTGSCALTCHGKVHNPATY